MGKLMFDRRLMVIGLVVISSLGSSQELKDDGGITSHQYKTEIRKGNQIATTEFFTLVYSVPTWLEEVGRGAGPIM